MRQGRLEGHRIKRTPSEPIPQPVGDKYNGYCNLRGLEWRRRSSEEKDGVFRTVFLRLLEDFFLFQAFISKRKFLLYRILWVAVISAKNHKRRRRKRQSVTAERERSQTPKVLTAIQTLPNLT